MKHLKRIFEDYNHKKVGEMIKYITDCFVDLFDEGAIKDFDDEEDLYEIKIEIKSYRENRREAGWDSKNINNFINTIDLLRDTSILIDECIEKVQIKYPDIDYTVSLDNRDNSIHNLYINVTLYLGTEDSYNYEDIEF